MSEEGGARHPRSLHLTTLCLVHGFVYWADGEKLPDAFSVPLTCPLSEFRVNKSLTERLMAVGLKLVSRYSLLQLAVPTKLLWISVFTCFLRDTEYSASKIMFKNNSSLVPYVIVNVLQFNNRPLILHFSFWTEHRNSLVQ